MADALVPPQVRSRIAKNVTIIRIAVTAFFSGITRRLGQSRALQHRLATLEARLNAREAALLATKPHLQVSEWYSIGYPADITRDWGSASVLLLSG